MEKFLSRVAKYIIKNDFFSQDKTVILPNRRAGLFLKNHISEQINEPVFLPRILTIEEFFYETSGLIKVEPVEQLFRLFQSHKQVMENGDSFEEFLNWAQTFLNDCNEIDTNLIPVEEFFNLLYRDREIRNWNLGAELTSMQQDYLNFWKSAKNLYVDFTANLLNENKAYNGLAYRYTIENKERLFSSVAKNSLLFVGFNALNRAEEELFDFVNENELGDFLWDTDEYYIENKSNKAGQYFRNYREKWQHDDLTNPKNLLINHNQQIEIIRAPNTISQCEIATQLINQIENPGAETAIILADEDLLEPLLHQLPAEHSYNITMGKSIHQFPLFHLFDHLLAFIHLRENNEQIIVSSLMPLLQSSYLKRIEINRESNQLISYIINNNSSFLSFDEINHLLNKESIWRRILQEKFSINQIFELFHFLIEELRITYINEQNRLSVQVLFEIKKIIQQLETLLNNFKVVLTPNSLKQLFRQVCSSVKIPYEGEPLEGVQIMGVLETRCLDFERIILLSANEGILPKGRQQNSFIPFIFKHHFQIQTFKDKDAIYAYTFYRLLHYCKQNTFVYNGLDGKYGEKSRFLIQLEAELPEQVSIHSIQAGYATPVLNQTIYQIEKTDEILAQIQEYIIVKGLSPSTINQIVRSPLDFYFQKIAGIREQEEIETELEANTFGTITHNALENIYDSYENKVLDHSFFSNANHIYEDVIEEEFMKTYRHGNSKTGINYLYKQAIKRIVKETIALDEQRAKTHEIKIIKLEKRLECSMPLTIFDEEFQITFKGNADRIQFRDNVIEIIDYKTGVVDGAKLSTKSIDKIHHDILLDKLQQILCYSLMGWQGEEFPLEQIRSAMQPLKSWNTGLVFLNNSPNYALSEEVMQSYIRQIELILEHLLNPELPFVPEEDENRLKYSAYKGIYL